MILYPWLALIADPARFARKYQRRLALERKQNVHVAVNNLEPRHVKHCALEAGVLVAADQQRVQSGLLHVRADVLVPSFNFFLTWHV